MSPMMTGLRMMATGWRKNGILALASAMMPSLLTSLRSKDTANTMDLHAPTGMPPRTTAKKEDHLTARSGATGTTLGAMWTQCATIQSLLNTSRAPITRTCSTGESAETMMTGKDQELEGLLLLLQLPLLLPPSLCDVYEVDSR